jgi:DNA repair protein RadA/Sms
MPKATTQFVCQQCGYETPKWMGKCPECGEWNSLTEEALPQAAPLGAGKRAASATVPQSRPEKVSEVVPLGERRLVTQLGEFDRVLGGGIVPGSLVLIGGDPGIGKSTLLTQVAGQLGQTEGKVLYVSGEESAHQIRLRADRLNVGQGDLFLASETDILAVEHQVHQMKPRLLVVDSIQTVYHPQIESAPAPPPGPPTAR